MVKDPDEPAPDGRDHPDHRGDWYCRVLSLQTAEEPGPILRSEIVIKVLSFFPVIYSPVWSNTRFQGRSPSPSRLSIHIDSW